MDALRPTPLVRRPAYSPVVQVTHSKIYIEEVSNFGIKGDVSVSWKPSS